MPQRSRLADVPRAITWDEVRRMVETVDQRAGDSIRATGRPARLTPAPSRRAPADSVASHQRTRNVVARAMSSIAVSAYGVRTAKPHWQ